MNINIQKLFSKSTSVINFNNFNLGNITKSGLNEYTVLLLYIAATLNIPNIYGIFRKLIKKSSKQIYSPPTIKILRIFTIAISTLIIAPQILGNGEIIEFSNIGRICVLILAIINFFENFEYLKKKNPENKNGIKKILTKISESFEFIARLYMTCFLFRIGAIILTNPLPLKDFIRWITFTSGLANIYFITRDAIKN